MISFTLNVQNGQIHRGGESSFMVSRGLGAQGNEVTEFPLGVIKIFFFFNYLFIYLFKKFFLFVVNFVFQNQIEVVISQIYECVLSRFRCVQLGATLWTVDSQAPLSMGSSRQECWSGFPCPLPRDLPNPGVKHRSLALAGRFFTTTTTWESFTDIQIY